MTHPSTPKASGGGMGGAAGGLLAGAALSLAAEAVKNWNDERGSRRAIKKLFWGQCVDSEYNLRPGWRCLEVAGLKFEVSEVLRKDWGQDEYYEVKVTNEQYPGDDRRRVRTFRYFTGNKAHGIEAKKGSIGWPPYIVHSTPKKR